MNEKSKITKLPPAKFWYPHLLKALQELGGTATTNDAMQKTVSFFDVDEAKFKEATKKLKNPNLFYNIGWAKTSLMLADYIHSPKKGIWELTSKAKKEMPDILDFIDKDISKENGGCTDALTDRKINVTPFIDDIEIAWKEELNRRQQNKQQSADKQNESADNAEDNSTDKNDFSPEEAYQLYEELEVVTSMDPLQFERLCKKLFEKMDYKDVENTRPTKDGGFDGVGYLTFGLVRFKVAFEAKKYAQKSTVGERDIKIFDSSMGEIAAEKGVFITTANFTKDAKAFAEKKGKIALINGEKLIELLRKHKIGYDERIVLDINREFFKNL